MALRPCRHCRQLVPAEQWTAHLQAHKNDGRPSTTDRGYGSTHQTIRKAWKVRIESGELIHCARGEDCRLKDRPEGDVILLSDDWELDHVDRDKGRYLGISHLLCNRATAGRRS